MTPLAAHADQAVRHAVDAYIDGRFLPTFEGEAGFETRNSRYRLLDGVLIAAPDATLVGAELVGWLIEYPARSEVTPTWKNGARAILVDTRNDGVRGPHIVVTSATRGFRSERPGSAPRLAAPVPQNSGSPWTQGGSSTDQAWARHPAPVAPPAPVSPSWGYYPAAVPAPVAAAPAAGKTLPPPPLVPAFPHAPPRVLPRPLPPPPAYADGSMARRIEACGTQVEADAGHAFQSGDHHRRSSARLSQGATRSPLPPALESSPYAYDARQSLPRTATDTLPRSRAHQRGMPLR